MRPRDSVTSVKVSTAPSMSPDSARIGATVASISRSNPSCMRLRGRRPRFTGVPAVERLLHELGEQLLVGLAGAAEHLFRRQARGRILRDAQQLRRGGIEVIDAALRIERCHRARHRRQRRRARASARACRAPSAATVCVGMTSTPTMSSARWPSCVIGAGAELEPRELALQAEQLDFIARRGGLIRQQMTNVLADQLGIFRRHQVLEPSPDELGRLRADQPRELRIGVEDAARAVDQHDLVQLVAERAHGRRPAPGANRARRGSRASAGG